ncbi:hypothetical protein [Baaleninema sp.]|uniref:hypothetical protein n=1 Tax=Baaleninema sp. TaxID=3101197 RepID=UPI003D063B85
MGFHNLNAATLVGAIVFAVWLGCVLMLFWNSYASSEKGWDLAELNRAKGWIMLGGYSLLSGLFAALGRVGLGLEQALEPRYTTFSLYAIVSAMYLGALLAEPKGAIAGSSSRRRWRSRGAYLLLGIGLLLHLKTSAFALEGMSLRQSNTLRGQACTLTLPILRDEDCLRRFVYPDVDRLFVHATAIDDMGYLHPPLLESDDVRDFRASPDSTTARGFFDVLTPLSGDRYQVHGWAEFTERSPAPVDLVLLTYTTVSGTKKPFAAIHDREFRLDALHPGLLKNTQLGWFGEFSRATLPNRSLTVEAWAFDATNARVYPLKGTFDLPPLSASPTVP